MPYITQEQRENIRSGRKAMTAGELNYLISKELHEYITRRGKSYNVLNEVLGVLEASKLELYRRIVAPYEDEKIFLNGDI